MARTYTVTTNPATRTFTVTQDGESRTFEVNTGVGPAGSDADVTLANVRAAVPNMVEVASPTDDDMIQRVGGSWVTRTLAQIKTTLGLGTAAYTASTAYAPTSHTHVSADVTDATDNGKVNPTKLLKTAANGSVVVSLLHTSDGTYAARYGVGPPGTLTDDRLLQAPNADGILALTSQTDGSITPADITDLSGVNTGDETAASIAAIVTGATGKTTPVDADEVGITDSAASYGLKKLTFANLWAWVKSKIESVALSTISITGTTNIGSPSSTASKLNVGNSNTSNSNIKTGSLEFQPYSLGNAWIGENVYFNAGFKYRATGKAGLFYFLGDEGQFRFAPSGTAGTAPTPQISTSCNWKINYDGTMAVGPQLNATSGNTTGYKFKVDPSGNVSTAGSIGFTANSGTWDGATMAGDQTLSGQLELTGQAATGDDSAMTRALVDARPVRALVYLSANQAISTAAYNKIIFDVEEYDGSGAFASGTFTAPRAGFVTVHACIYNGGSAGNDTISLHKNNVEFKRMNKSLVANGHQLAGSCIVQVAQGDTLDIRYYSNASTSILGGSTITWAQFQLD